MWSPILVFMAFQLLLVEVWGSIAQLHCTFGRSTFPVCTNSHVFMYINIKTNTNSYINEYIYIYVCVEICVYMH